MRYRLVLRTWQDLFLMETQGLAISREDYGFRFQEAGHRLMLCDIRLYLTCLARLTNVRGC